MRGEIIRTVTLTEPGLISGDDGQRYSFSPDALKGIFDPRPGLKVDFSPQGDRAAEIYALSTDGVVQQEGSGENLSVWGYFVKCMRLYFNGSGRARRKEYWSFVLFRFLFTLMICLVVSFVVYLLTSHAWAQGTDSASGSEPGMFAVWFVWVLMGLPFTAPGWAVAARRLHDIGMSGWLALLMLIPYVGGLFMLVCALIPSQRGTNQYGRYPKPQFDW